jgi:radical SAM protein with 4Fe4S-binding SPASM domain
MDCEYLPKLSLLEFGQKLRKAPAPLGGTIELTHRCNLGCVHCYCRRPAGDRTAREAEMSYDTICRIVDEAAEMGCLTLLVTGGEPLLRDDFPEIYKYIVSKGILVVLFTNATLVTSRIIDLLSEYPPLLVEVSLYGPTQKVYESITGVPGSFRRCVEGIRMLADMGVDFYLKTPTMAQNKDHLADLEEFSNSLGIDFRFGVMLNPRLNDMDCRFAPYDHRLSLQEIVDLEFSTPERVAFWESFVENQQSSSRSDTIYHCGAGLFGFLIDDRGSLNMCALSREPGYDLVNGTFREGWASLVKLRQRPRDLDNGADGCHHCEFFAYCFQCPGRAQLEHGLGVRTRPVEWLCELAHLRAERISTLKGERR